MRVATFRADCARCGAEFALPLLSDQQSYGECIAFGSLGRSFAYLNTFAEPAWDEIDRICSMFLPLRDAAAGSEPIAVFQRIVGECSDMIQEESFRVGQGPVCPRCHSESVRYGDSIKVGSVDLPALTFDRFWKLTQIQRQDFIKSLVEGIQGQPVYGER
jgi:hypothetical protein